MANEVIDIAQSIAPAPSFSGTIFGHYSLNAWTWVSIGHFRVLLCLCFKTSLSETFHMKMSSACSFIFMQIKVIFIRMVSHLVSLWSRGTRELGNSLLTTSLYREAWVCRSEGLQTLQNRAAGLITFCGWNIRSSTLLGDLGWDCLERRRSKQLDFSVWSSQ